MAYNILVLNIGSTSFKFRYYDMETASVLAEGKIGSVFAPSSPFSFEFGSEQIKGNMDASKGYEPCIKRVAELVEEKCPGGCNAVKAIGFKTVMAGDTNRTCKLDDDVLAKMEEYSIVAPAHNTPYIEAVKIAEKIFPSAVPVGAFETDFHSTIPEYAAMYPIDKDMAKKYGIRKYGFHGAAHSNAAKVLSALGHRRIVSVHLGGSSSVCAILDGKSIDTSMGFSPQSGLPMNNRCGDIDAFALLYIMEKENMSVKDAREFLCKKGGLLGMSGISNDIRDIEDKGCEIVTEAFAYSTAKYICSYLASLGGIDAISFSGGIGENDISLKKAICKRLSFMGAELGDIQPGERAEKEPVLISSDKSAVKIYITPIDEEIMVAEKTYAYMKGLK